MLQSNDFKFVYLKILLVSALVFSCYEEQEIPVAIDFEYTIPQGGYTVPVQVALTNETTGADFYRWTFEGASPSSSDVKNPGTITYGQAGTYTIRLEAWNDTQRETKKVTIELDSAVTIDFSVNVLINDFVPATIDIDNKTVGGSTYKWTFEDGEPHESTLAVPPQVQFDTPGDHLITLEVTNGRETFTISKTITLKPAMQTDFEIIPSFQDEDFEAPLTAELRNLTVNGLTYKWSSTGGSLLNSESEHTQIFFDSPGDYVVTLKADNEKEVHTVQYLIHVKPNSNLFVMNDVKLGVNGAHSSIGSFYAPMLRDALIKDEVNTNNGHLVDLVFFGINSSFSYCRFVSPDSASKFSFPTIPNATHSYFVNTLESTTFSFNAADFDAMVTDAPLTGLDIKSNDTGAAFFTDTQTPRVILFETEDGRKGAIKIKSFVAEGTQSHILMDIKIQKE
jgi:PKD repeat protein